MNVEAYYCLQDAVRLARDQQIQKVDTLRRRLDELGYKPETVQEAIQTWANFAVEKKRW